MDSNDLLYYGDAEYKQELEGLMDSVLGKVIVSVNEGSDRVSTVCSVKRGERGSGLSEAMAYVLLQLCLPFS